MPMSRMLYQDERRCMNAAGKKVRFIKVCSKYLHHQQSDLLPLACSKYYVRYWHLNSSQEIQAFTRDSIVGMRTGHSIPVG